MLGGSLTRYHTDALKSSGEVLKRGLKRKLPAIVGLTKSQTKL